MVLLRIQNIGFDLRNKMIECKSVRAFLSGGIVLQTLTINQHVEQTIVNRK